MGIKENTVDWDPQFKIIEDISCKNQQNDKVEMEYTVQMSMSA